MCRAARRAHSRVGENPRHGSYLPRIPVGHRSGSATSSSARPAAARPVSALARRSGVVVGVVDFFSPRWSQGSGLTVGVMWRWQDVGHVTFNVHEKVEGSQEFRHE